jgi:hypothetical protein
MDPFGVPPAERITVARPHAGSSRGGAHRGVRSIMTVPLALITGGAQGIGRALAQSFLAEGWRTHIVGQVVSIALSESVCEPEEWFALRVPLSSRLRSRAQSTTVST